MRCTFIIYRFDPSVDEVSRYQEYAVEAESTDKILDCLNKIRWDSGINPDDFSIHYTDRVTGQLKKVNFKDIQIKGDFMKTDDSMIPMHRIRKIKYGDKVVWDRRRI